MPYFDGDLNFLVTAQSQVSSSLAQSPYFLTTNGSARVAPGPAGVAYEDILEAPVDPSQYVQILQVFTGESYVVFTLEGHYAKLRVTQLGTLTFEYVYQDDGSRVLDPDVPVQASSWSQIKALYSD